MDLIIERFVSIQGEGKYIGQLSIFIRFSGCNEKCSFCDTKYSWNEKGKYSVDDIVNYINDNDDINHIVLTGGEPMIHQKEILEILHKISFLNPKIITIETNGTIIPIEELRVKMFNFGLWSVSPKSDKCNMKLFDGYNKVQFKFVIENVNQIDKIKEINLHHQKIIQPNGFREDYSEACRELAEYIIEKRYSDIIVLPQFHRIMWGQKRGI